MTLVECNICQHQHNAMREHCPVCGARRAFIASHSYEPYRVVVTARSCEHLERELVRAFRSDIAFAFVTAQ